MHVNIFESTGSLQRATIDASGQTERAALALALCITGVNVPSTSPHGAATEQVLFNRCPRDFQEVMADLQDLCVELGIELSYTRFTVTPYSS